MTTTIPCSPSYRQILLLSLPVIVSNATVPIQGLIDVAIVGHLDSSDYLSAVGLAAEFFSLLFVSFNFLQYASSGLSAQALGEKNYARLGRVLYRSVLIALVIGLLLIALQWLWPRLGLWFFAPTGQVADWFVDYLAIRIWGAPIELANYALFGWFVGQGKSAAVLRQQLVMSLSNVGLNIVFVVILGYGVAGVAMGTVVANAMGMGYALLLAKRSLSDLGQSALPLNWTKLLQGEELKKLLRLNRDIMIRTTILTLSFAWIMRLGAQQGELLLAANVVLLQLLFISAYAIDGVAVTTESLVGQVFNQNNHKLLTSIVWRTTWVSLLIAALITGGYFVIKPLFLTAMTDLPEVRQVASQYFVFAAIVPLVGVLAYQFDGVMFGMTANRIIRNSMLVVGLVFFPISSIMAHYWGNTGVWLSVYLLFILRAVTLMWQYFFAQRDIAYDT